MRETLWGAVMAVWDLLTPSTSQSTYGNVDEGDFVGAAMAVWDLLTPSTSQGACGKDRKSVV